MPAMSYVQLKRVSNEIESRSGPSGIYGMGRRGVGKGASRSGKGAGAGAGVWGCGGVGVRGCRVVQGGAVAHGCRGVGAQRCPLGVGTGALLRNASPGTYAACSGAAYRRPCQLFQAQGGEGSVFRSGLPGPPIAGGPGNRLRNTLRCTLCARSRAVTYGGVFRSLPGPRRVADGVSETVTSCCGASRCGAPERQPGPVVGSIPRLAPEQSSTFHCSPIGTSACRDRQHQRRHIFIRCKVPVAHPRQALACCDLQCLGG